MSLLYVTSVVSAGIVASGGISIFSPGVPISNSKFKYKSSTSKIFTPGVLMFNSYTPGVAMPNSPTRGIAITNFSTPVIEMLKSFSILYMAL